MRTIENIEYAVHDGQPLHLNLYLPDAPGPYPVVFWLSGGGWAQCINNDRAAFLTEAGFAVPSVYYRVSSEAIAPANVRDCKAAIRWARANAARYQFNPSRIGVFGASAGGHLAALLAMSDGVCDFEEGDHPGFSSAVQAACDFCGPSDLTRIAEPENRAAFSVLYDVTASYLGGPVEENLGMARLLSPLSYVVAPSPPLFIVHGDNDQVVPVEESHLLYNAMKRHGAAVEMDILEGGGHAWDWGLTNDCVTNFFQRTLGPIN